MGYIHGDLKPDNILFKRVGNVGEEKEILYLIDFGLARKFKSHGSHIT